MKPALRHQLAQLDRTLLALFNERASLLQSVPSDDPGRLAATQDLLRRHAGPFDAKLLEQVFALLDRGCGSDCAEVER
jgi:chorismate mutase